MSIYSASSQVNARMIKVLWRQQQELLKKSPDCVTPIINTEDPLDIQADIEGPQGTPYENGIFRVKLFIPSEFPQVAPKGVFMTKIFHPNVSEKGEICVNTLKRDWNPTKWSLYNLFEVIKCLLIVPFPQSSLNEEAGKMFMENYDEYFRVAKMFTQIHAKKKIEEKKDEDKEEKSKVETEGDVEMKEQGMGEQIQNNNNNIIITNNSERGILNFKKMNSIGGTTNMINFTNLTSNKNQNLNFANRINNINSMNISGNGFVNNFIGQNFNNNFNYFGSNNNTQNSNNVFEFNNNNINSKPNLSILPLMMNSSNNLGIQNNNNPFGFHRSRTTTVNFGEDIRRNNRDEINKWLMRI